MKKRILACIVFMAVLCTAFPAFAEETVQPITGSCGEKLRYEYYQSTRTLTIIGNGNMPNYPSDKREGSIAPWRNDSRIDNYLEKVVISDGVTSIGENAFFWCDKITSVTISSSVKSIGMGAFYSCIALTDITIPNGTESIGEDAFTHCNGLKEVTVPGSVKSIGEGAFSSCDELTKVTIQDGAESMGAFAFKGCKKLTDVTLPNSIKSIGDYAFQETGLYDLYDHTGWDVCYIGNHLIAANQSISGTCDVKPKTKTIAGGAFASCGNLEGITIPDSVVSIGNHAFFSCSSLTGITIPKSVTSIGDYAFQVCGNLTEIRVDTNNTAYCSANGILYNKEKTEIICFPNKKQDTLFTIPNSVTSIADGAFSDCQNLTSVTIPNSVTSIGNDAFNSCSGLTSVTIPDGVTSLGNKAFFGCSSLTSVTIPNSVMSIGEDAFRNCYKLKKVNYIGSETDWNSEVIGGGKYFLTNIGITYLSGISARRSDDGNIVVKPINIAAGKTVILALYDGNKFIEMQQSNEYSETEITFIPTKTYTRAKVMIWNSLSEMSPVCDFKIVK